MPTSARRAFEPGQTIDPVRFAQIDAIVRRDYTAGRLRLTGPALCYWMIHNTDRPLKEWVMREIDDHQRMIGMVRCTNGWVRFGEIDTGDRHVTGIRLREDAQGPTIVYAAFGDPSPNQAGASWQLAVQPIDEIDERDAEGREPWEMDE